MVYRCLTIKAASVTTRHSEVLVSFAPMRHFSHWPLDEASALMQNKGRRIINSRIWRLWIKLWWLESWRKLVSYGKSEANCLQTKSGSRGYLRLGRLSGIPVEINSDRCQKISQRKKNCTSGLSGRIRQFQLSSPRAIRRNQSGIQTGKRSGFFMFLGPTGGIEAQTLAEVLFDDESALIRFRHEWIYGENSQLVVSNRAACSSGYVGYEEGGELTGKVHARPPC